MHFDDRLSTVLRHSASSGALARIQFRQLVDILAQAPEDLGGDLVEAGYARLDSLLQAIRSSDQADLIRQSLVRLTNPRLLAQLAEADPAIASAALAKTRLNEEQWLALIPALPIHARGILRHRRDLPPRVNALLEQLGIGDRALPPAILCESLRECEPLARAAEPAAPPPISAPNPPPSPANAAPVEPELATATAGIDAPFTPRTEAEVEELVLTHLLGVEEPAPVVLPPARDGNGPGDGATIEKPRAPGDAADAPPTAYGDAPQEPEPRLPSAPPPGPAIPTSLREWARLRASGRIATPSDSPFARGPVDPGIGAIVRRIEEFRRSREKPRAPEAANDSPRLPLGDSLPDTTSGPATIDFSTNAQGRITWADGVYAPAITGFNLPEHEEEGCAILEAVRLRLPIREAFITLTGTAPVSGTWQVDAAALFDPDTGRFTGHCGRLRRPATSQPARELPASTARAEADRMRQVLHELRTPANAIQVAAEIIQQQLYGPAPHEYRALAASIAGDCAHILAGFEELDRLVKLETGALALEDGRSDLAEIACQTMDRLSGWTGPRQSGFLPGEGFARADLPIALDHDEAERMIWRLLAALAGASASDERLTLDWAKTGPTLTLRLALPHALAEREGDALFAIGDTGRSQALTAGVFGVGFTLRLAAAEAVAAGGSLQRIANDLVLTLPLLTSDANGAAHTVQHS